MWAAIITVIVQYWGMDEVYDKVMHDSDHGGIPINEAGVVVEVCESSVRALAVTVFGPDL